MPIPKLYLFKAAEAKTIVILRRGEAKESWEMIRWDLDTDTFTEGQWLLKKTINPAYCAISPCGRFFAYHYDIYGYVKGKQAYESHNVVSAVPNFTALYFDGAALGHWDRLGFTASGEIISSRPMVKKGDVELPFAPAAASLAHSGYISTSEWMDPKGRAITTQDGKLLADGSVLYDTTGHVFVPRTPVS